MKQIGLKTKYRTPGNTICRVFLAILLIGNSVPLAAWAATEIRLSGDQGNPVVAGQKFVLTDANGVLSVAKGYTEGVVIEWEGSEGIYTFFFEGRHGEQLVPGTYEHSFEDPEPDRPGFSIFHSLGGSCSDTGSFTVHEVEYDQDGVASQLAMDVIHHCLGSPSLSQIQVRINSDVPFDLGPHVRAADDLVVSPGSLVEVAILDSSTTNGSITDYQWTQVGGNHVPIFGADSERISFTVPVSDSEHEAYVFDVTVTDSSGETATDSVTVLSAEVVATQSRYAIATWSGGFLGGTESLDANIDLAFIRTESNGVQRRIYYDPPDGSGWSLFLAGPNWEDIQIDQYSHAADVFSRPFNRPGAHFGLTHRGCNNPIGSFKVLDIGLAENKALERIAANVNILCRDAYLDPVEMRLRLDSVVPIYSRAPIADPGHDRVAIPGDKVLLDAHSTQNDFGEIESFLWRQISGPSVSLIGANTAEVSFIAPDVIAGGGEVVLELTVRNDSGFSDAETVSIELFGSQDPKNIVLIKSEPDTGYHFVVGSSDADIRFDENFSYFKIRQTVGRTTIEIDESISSWSFRFAPLGGEGVDPTMSPGLYENADDHGLSGPVIKMSGRGRGCNQDAGRFVVHEYVENSKGHPESVAIDFQHSCDYGGMVNGVIRFNSAVPLQALGLFASAGPDIEAISGQIIELHADGSFIGPTAGVTYEWEQVSGPPVALIGTDQPAVTFDAPAGVGVAVFRVTITTAEGLVDNATVSVDLLGSDAPMSGLYLQSTAGDPVGRGIWHYFDGSLMETRDYDTDRLSIWNFFGGIYNLWFSAPNGEAIAAGDYDNAFSYGDIPGFPGIEFSLASGGCQSSVGWFRIYEVEPNDDLKTIDNLAADFWQSCELGGPPIYGAVRINSKIPLRQHAPIANAGQNFVAREGRRIALSAERSFSFGAPLSGFDWTQISGPTATMTGGQTAKPEILLPQITMPTEELVFEVVVTDAAGLQSSDQTSVVVLDSSEPLDEFSAVLFDVETGEELGSVDLGPNNAFSEYEAHTYHATLNATGRHKGINLRFSDSTEYLPFENRFYHRFYEGDNLPGLDAGIADFATDTYASCDRSSYGWLDIVDVQMTNEIVSSFAFEAEQVCSDSVGVHISGRMNSTVPLLPGTLVIKQRPDFVVREGETASLEDVIAYVQGERLAEVGWEQVSGSPIVLASMPGGRTSFVGPVTDGDSVIELRLSVTSAAQQTIYEDVSVTVLENNISGFPVGLITTTGAVGPFGATGKPIAIDADHLVVLRARAPTLSGGSVEPGTTPYGVFDFEFDTSPGEAISFTVHFADAVDPGATWISHQEATGWISFDAPWAFAPDMRSVSIEVTDGGSGDLDGKVNGWIITSGAVSWDSPPAPTPPQPPPPVKKSGGGGGSTNLASLVILLLFRMLRYHRIRDFYMRRRIQMIAADPKQPVASDEFSTEWELNQ